MSNHSESTHISTDEELLDHCDPGSWIQIVRYWRLFLGFGECHVLACLISASRQVKHSKIKSGKEYDGWFYHTQSQIEDEILCSRDTIDRAIATFKNLGIIEVKRKGIPAKRWFRLKTSVLFRILEEETRKYLENKRCRESGNKLPENQATGCLKKPQQSKNRINKRKASALSQAATRPDDSELSTPSKTHSKGNNANRTATRSSGNKDNNSPKDRSVFGINPKKDTIANGLSKRLYNESIKRRKLQNPPKTLDKWDKEFQHILDTKFRTAEELHELMDWFFANMDHRYTPKTYCAKSFCERITDMEDARDRKKDEDEKTQKKANKEKDQSYVY